jgi:hypothetical protein
MTYNLLETIKMYDGKDVLEGDPSKSITWQDVIGGVVNSVDNETTGEVKAKIYRITIKAYDKPKEAQYTADEVATILSQITKFSTPLIIGRAEDFFNQNTKK